MTRGRFLVLEGGEGSGKSTQVPRLAARLRASGREVLVTFEPGATARGRQLREVLLEHHSPLDPRAELLLMAADRAQHIGEVVAPALAHGTDVVSDRFTPSTVAYQGVGRGLGVDAAEQVCTWAAGDVVPDAVVVLDVAETVAATRRPPGSDRFEAEGAEFHERVRAAYRDLAGPRGWIVVDGDQPPDAVEAAVWDAVRERLAMPR